MPLIDVFFAKGSLSPEAQRLLLNTMWSSALRWEAIEDLADLMAEIAGSADALTERREHAGKGLRPPSLVEGSLAHLGPVGEATDRRPADLRPTLLGHSASRSERLFLPLNGPSLGFHIRTPQSMARSG